MLQKFIVRICRSRWRVLSAFAVAVSTIGTAAVTAPAGSASAATPSELLQGQALSNNGEIVSPDGQYRLLHGWPMLRYLIARKEFAQQLSCKPI